MGFGLPKPPSLPKPPKPGTASSLSPPGLPKPPGGLPKLPKPGKLPGLPGGSHLPKPPGLGGLFGRGKGGPGDLTRGGTNPMARRMGGQSPMQNPDSPVARFKERMAANGNPGKNVGAPNGNTGIVPPARTGGALPPSQVPPGEGPPRLAEGGRVKKGKAPPFVAKKGAAKPAGKAPPFAAKKGMPMKGMPRGKKC